MKVCGVSQASHWAPQHWVSRWVPVWAWCWGWCWGREELAKRDRSLINLARCRAWNAAVPATNARPNAQVWCISNQGDHRSVVLDSLRDGCLAYLDTGSEVVLVSGNHRVSENSEEQERILSIDPRLLSLKALDPDRED